MPNHSNSQHIELRLSTSQSGSGLYPTRTKLDHFEFPRSGPAIDQKEGPNRASQVFSGNSQLSIGVEEERLGWNWLDLSRSQLDLARSTQYLTQKRLVPRKNGEIWWWKLVKLVGFHATIRQSTCGYRFLKLDQVSWGDLDRWIGPTIWFDTLTLNQWKTKY